MNLLASCSDHLCCRCLIVGQPGGFCSCCSRSMHLCIASDSLCHGLKAVAKLHDGICPPCQGHPHGLGHVFQCSSSCCILRH